MPQIIAEESKTQISEERFSELQIENANLREEINSLRTQLQDSQYVRQIAPEEIKTESPG